MDGCGAGTLLVKGDAARSLVRLDRISEVTLDVIIEQDVFPFHSGTHVVDDPRFTGTVSRTRNDDADVLFRVGE